MTIANPLSYFPETYAEGRARFLQASAEAKARLPEAESRSFQVHSRRGDSDLFIDDFYLPPSTESARTLIVLTSGVHGIEGATGSAIQSYVFQNFLSRFPREQAGILMIHSLNPFGFKYGRRNTENNVNLNRAFTTTTDLFKSRNDGFRKLAKLLTPNAGPVQVRKNSRTQTALLLMRAMLFGGFSPSRLNQTIAQGQYEFADSLEFGGTEMEPSVEFLTKRFLEIFPRYDRILLFDLHTGLGERAQLHLIPADLASACDPELFTQVFRPLDDRDLYSITPADAPGFYRTTGDLTSVLPELAKRQQKIVAVTLEFGTLGLGSKNKIETLDRLLLENAGFHRGYRSANDEKEVGLRFRELFYPSDLKWRETVLAKGVGTIQRAIERLPFA